MSFLIKKNRSKISLRFTIPSFSLLSSLINSFKHHSGPQMEAFASMYLPLAAVALSTATLLILVFKAVRQVLKVVSARRRFIASPIPGPPLPRHPLGELLACNQRVFGTTMHTCMHLIVVAATHDTPPPSSTSPNRPCGRDCWTALALDDAAVDRALRPAVQDDAD